jgi:pilus assembly protein CpaB
MTRRRRAAALLGLAVALGVLAASDVAGREAALRRRLGPAVPVVVAARPLAAGERIARAALALRLVPARYAPAGALADPADAVGRHAAVAVPAGADLEPGLLAVPEAGASDPPGPALRRGERSLELLAVAAPEDVVAGARVDVLVTYDGRDGAPGATRLALQDADVLSVRPAQAAEGAQAGSGLPRVRAALRVSVRQAVALTAAAATAAEVRLLARPPP